jgi:cytochrome c
MKKCLWLLGAMAVLACGSARGEDDGFVISGDPVKGEATYKLYCVLCHGATGLGDGPGAAALNPKPRNFQDKAEMSKISDKEIFTAIKSGGAAVGKSPLMVAWGAILGDDQKVHDVAAYVRSLAK